MEPSLLDRSATNDPPTECDIIMKGGITSGVVYPPAVCELADSFDIRSIGGASAGAIAAALTAAAQYRKNTTGDTEGFSELNELGAQLSSPCGPKGKKTVLESLFQPQTELKSAFMALFAFIDTGGPFAKVRRALAAIALNPMFMLIGASLGLALAVLFYFTGDGFSQILGIIVGLALMFGGGVAGGVIELALTAVTTLPQNFYGMCTGMPGYGRVIHEPLTVWLSKKINEIAGRPGEGTPLTFGDLERAMPKSQQGRSADELDDVKGIELKMMTSCLTLHQPFVLPFESPEVYFKKSDFDELFPEHIVDHLIAHSPGTVHGLHQLPPKNQLPVIVATRMSLSFPVLLSAIPLYLKDHTRAKEEDRSVPDRVWFSDGGLTSNLPLHFFDSALPSRPTFAINLRKFHPDRPQQEKESENIHMASTNTEGMYATWSRFGSFMGFASALLKTMQNWTDNLQAQTPGYRDRIVHIQHSDKEGGMNLNMPDSVIKALTERGKYAGKTLVKRYTTAPAGTKEIVSWDNHKWVRYRSTMSALERFLIEYERGYNVPAGELGGQTYTTLCSNGTIGVADKYDVLDLTRKATMGTHTTSLNKIAGLVGGQRPFTCKPNSAQRDVPAPPPELNVSPRIPS